MSGNGKNTRTVGGIRTSGRKSGGGSSGQSRNAQPTLVTGYQYHQYAQNSDRYVYIGKDEDGEPEFLDYGPKGGRR